MGANSAIEWTDHTFNPWIGCSKVSPGCANCYAEADFDRRKHRVTWGPHGTRILTSQAYWKQPAKWNAEAAAAGVRRRVFCASLADVFEQWYGTMQARVGGQLIHLATRTGAETDACWPKEPGWRPLAMEDIRTRLFEVIRSTPNLDWLLLTKRPDYAAIWLRAWLASFDVFPGVPPLENLWVGTSVENQETVEKRIPELLTVPAVRRFVSCEPLLSNMILRFYPARCPNCGAKSSENVCGLRSNRNEPFQWFCRRGACGNNYALPAIGWVIVGGESGPNARPMHPDWVRSIRNQCNAAGVPFFFKQSRSDIYFS